MKRLFPVVFVLFPLVCLLTSCAEEISKTDFEKSIREHATETINNVWYTGSANGFDYFIHNTATRSRNVRLKTNEISLATRFPLTDNRQKWRLVKGDADLSLRENPIQSLDSYPGFRIESSPGKKQ